MSAYSMFNNARSVIDVTEIARMHVQAAESPKVEVYFITLKCGVMFPVHQEQYAKIFQSLIDAGMVIDIESKKNVSESFQQNKENV